MKVNLKRAKPNPRGRSRAVVWELTPTSSLEGKPFFLTLRTHPNLSTLPSRRFSFVLQHQHQTRRQQPPSLPPSSRPSFSFRSRPRPLWCSSSPPPQPPHHPSSTWGRIKSRVRPKSRLSSFCLRRFSRTQAHLAFPPLPPCPLLFEQTKSSSVSDLRMMFGFMLIRLVLSPLSPFSLSLLLLAFSRRVEPKVESNQAHKLTSPPLSFIALLRPRLPPSPNPHRLGRHPRKTPHRSRTVGQG